MGKRVQNFNLKNLETKVINLGYVGENVHTQIVIECSEVLWDYPNAVASMVVQPPRGDLYPVEVTREENNIIWEITASDVVYSGSGRVQLTFTNNGEIVKSAVGTTRISGSIEATGEAPEPLQNWMDQAEETARQMGQDVADATLEDLEETKEDCIAEIEQAGADTRATIPADYTQLSDDVTSLKSAFEQLDANVITETAGPSPIVSIADGADGMPMRKVEVAIEPVQDLHGYEYPWPAGGGKNLLPGTPVNATTKGCTFTYDNGLVTLNGTASSAGGRTTFKTANFSLKAGTYTFKPFNISGTADQVYLQNGTEIIWGISSGPTSRTFTLESDYDALNIGINVKEGTSYNYSALFGIFTDSEVMEWTPYSNICPITGFTGAKVTRTGKNLFNIGLVNTSTGKLSVDGTTISKGETSVFYVDVFSVGSGLSKKVLFLKAGTYTISGVYVGNGTLRVYKLSDDAEVSGGKIADIDAVTSSNHFTLEKDSYVTLRFSTKDACTVTDLQIELGSTATDYEPYQGQTYEVTFPAEAGTVYGGTLDVVSGKLVVDRVYTTLNGSESWSGEQLSDPLKAYYFIRLEALGYLVDENIVCDKYRQVSITSQNEEIGINTLNSLARSRATLALRPNHLGMSVAEFKSWLSENPITCAYKITSTTVYQLISTEIKTLLGENRIFADAGNVAVTYPADTKTYIDNRINSTRKLIAGIETGFVASKAYAVGDMLIIGDDLYKAASSIASGATITVGTNVNKTTVAEQLLALANA